MRKRYLVTLFTTDNSRPQYTTWAESPEAAVRKVRDRETAAIAGRGLGIIHAWAEAQTGGEDV